MQTVLLQLTPVGSDESSEESPGSARWCSAWTQLAPGTRELRAGTGTNRSSLKASPKEEVFRKLGRDMGQVWGVEEREEGVQRYEPESRLGMSKNHIHIFA